MDVIGYAKGIGDDRQCRIHAAAGGEKRAIYNVQVLHLVRPVVGV